MRLQLATDPAHSLHVDRIRDYTEPTRRPIQPLDVAAMAAKAAADLTEAIAENNTLGIITANRRIVAVAGLAKAQADTLELGRRS